MLSDCYEETTPIDILISKNDSPSASSEIDSFLKTFNAGKLPTLNVFAPNFPDSIVSILATA